MQGSPSDHERKQRFHDLVDLVLSTRGWTKTEMGEAIGRDPTKIYPTSGNPKMDYLVGLARVLEWPVGEVIDATSGTTTRSYLPSGGAIPIGESFNEAHRRALDLYHDGEVRKLLDAADEMYALADTNNRRAGACLFAGLAWSGLGRFQLSADAFRHGLGLSGVDKDVWWMLQVNLANSLYALWDLIPALGVAEFVVRSFDDQPSEDPEDRKSAALGRYVRGNTWRRLAALDPALAKERFAIAIDDLRLSSEAFDELADEIGDRNLRGIAHVCHGAILECEVELGRREVEPTIDEMMQQVESGRVADEGESWLEAVGWWAIFACNIAMRHFEGRTVQRAMHTLLDHALEVADELDNWAMRERVLTLRMLLHDSLTQATGLDLPLTIGERERALLCPVMGRFPKFREEIGWTMIHKAGVVASAASRSKERA